MQSNKHSEQRGKRNHLEVQRTVDTIRHPFGNYERNKLENQTEHEKICVKRERAS